MVDATMNAKKVSVLGTLGLLALTHVFSLSSQKVSGESSAVRTSSIISAFAASKASLPLPLYHDLPGRWRSILENRSLDNQKNTTTGRELYDGLNVSARTLLLNVFSKAEKTTLGDGSCVLDHIRSVYNIKSDRLFALADPELGDALARSVADGTINKRGRFSAMLHKAPPAYDKIGSYKTRDRQGILDMTLSASRDGRVFVLEMDIDHRRGIRHMFEVVSNLVKGEKTDPLRTALILYHQGMGPIYRAVTETHDAHGNERRESNPYRNPYDVNRDKNLSSAPINPLR